MNRKCKAWPATEPARLRRRHHRRTANSARAEAPTHWSLYGLSWTYLDAIGGTCWNVATRSYPGTQIGKFYRGTGGQVFLNDDCSLNYAISSLYIRSANWVDGVRGTRSYIAP